MTYTRSDINTILVTNDKAVERAMIRLFELQNSDEQVQGTANEQNGRGFCSSDALVGSRFARWVQGMDNKNVVRYAPKSLNDSKAVGIFGKYCQDGGSVMDRARKIALKHSAQLVIIANEKAVKAEPARVEPQSWHPLSDALRSGTFAATARLMEQRLDDLGLLGWELCDEMKES